MSPLNEALIIEVAAKEVAAELKRQGIDPDERVTLTIRPELIPGRRAPRRLVGLQAGRMTTSTV